MDGVTRSGLVVPDAFGSSTQASGPIERRGELPDGRGTIVNETGLPDEVVMQAAQDHFVESASMAWGHQTNFQMYSNQRGSLLARSDFQTPTNVIEEIKLARDLAERDDDVAAVLRQMVATAFGEGMEHVHSDERSTAIFNAVARNADLDRAFKEMYREYLIASQVTTATLYTREELEFTLQGASSSRTEQVTAPVIGVLHAECVRVIGNDMFGTAILAYDPPDARLREWLEEYFNPRTTAARKAEMGRADRASANLFTGVYKTNPLDPPEDRPGSFGTDRLFLLNPRLCHRTSMPKGAWKYPRPLMTANFALLEAKRLLNIMDYALLQGGSNFVVVAKKGTDERPAQPEEVENLKQVVRVASRSGVIVGDHRLTFEIITPKLDELLNASKRRLLGRKIAMRMLGTAERGEETGSKDEASDIEIIGRVITSDRNDLRRHVENRIYPEVVKRNRSILKKGPAGIWFPKIVLQGLDYFTDLVLKLRDRGDISRATAVAAAGFDLDAELAKRQAELDRGVDEIMTPGTVPHSSPDAGPQDNNEGRPKGSGDGESEKDPAKPQRVVRRTPGETVKAWFDEDLEEVVRFGEITYSILEEHEATAADGRVNSMEREVVAQERAISRGGTHVVPVNVGVPIEGELKSVRLREGLWMVVGYRRGDGAIMAKAIKFQEPKYQARDAENTVARWGFPLALIEPPPGPEPEPEPKPEPDE